MAISFDERINWSHNEPINRDEESVGKTKKFFRKAGATTQRRKVNPDTPPFILRQVPYDVWRKHYAKNKDGDYRGTHAPAEDCLLRPDDVQKWRFGEPVTQADRWTRGPEALPVYAEVRETSAVPEYELEYDGPPRSEPPLAAIEEPVLDEEDARLAAHVERRQTHSGNASTPAPQTSIRSQSTANATDSLPSTKRPSQGRTIAEGKTAAQIIAEAREKGRPKRGWKGTFDSGIRGLMGTP